MTRACLAVALAACVLVPAEGIALQDAAVNVWVNLEKARGYLEAAGEAGFSGVVLIGRADSVVLEEAYGFAEIEHRIPMRTDHRFRIGSLTKPITASAVLVAVDRGLLSLETRPCDLIPSCPPSWAEVTARNLLTHTSGIADHFGDLESVPVEATFEELRRVLDSLPAEEPLRTHPGAEYAYSNFNYVLLGALLERVGEAPWERILHDWVFEPLGLATMAYDDVYAIVEDRVRGYEREESGGLRNIDYDDHAAYAAGGLLSTARDLFRWSRGMLKGELFGSGLVEESLTPFRGNYGYGWQVRRFFDRTIHNHSGGIDGFSSHLAHYPDADLTIVVLSNVENDLAILRACDVAARLFDWPAVSVPSEPALPPRQRCGL
ncbi:MAG: serine hydrolase domain-containing protein [Myxococcota bacterium]